MDQVQIGKFISTLRKEKGLTQEELGEQLGVTQKTISRWENGRNMPDIAMLPILCEELDITIAELMNGARSQEEELAKADVAQAINTFHVDDEMSVDVLERVAIGRQLYVLYSQLGTDGASGLAHLERGMFGKYRIMDTYDTNDPLAGVMLVTANGHQQTYSAGEERYALLYNANELPDVSRLELYGADGGEHLPYDVGGISQSVDETYAQCLFSYEYDRRPLLKAIRLDADTQIDPFGRTIRYYDEKGDRCTPRQLEETFAVSDSARTGSTAVADGGMVYVLELIVLGIGVIYIRYFMK